MEIQKKLRILITDEIKTNPLKKNKFDSLAPDSIYGMNYDDDFYDNPMVTRVLDKINAIIAQHEAKEAFIIDYT